MSSKVYDISRAQKGLSMSELKKSGAAGVIIRLGVGDSAKYKGGQDTASDGFIKECEKIGLPYGFYFYSYALTKEAASKEISMFIGLALSYKKSKYKYFQMPCFFDMEEPSQWSQMLKGTREDIIHTWLNACAANGLQGAIYGSPSFLLNWITPPKNAKIWLAHYVKGAPQVKSSYIDRFNAIGWQYGTSKVFGYTVDINEWYAGIGPNASKPETIKKGSLKVGDRVKVDLGATTYEGRYLAQFVYVETYTIMELVNDRAVIGQCGMVTAAVNVKDLYKV